MDNFKVQLPTQNWIDAKPDDGRDFCSQCVVKIIYIMFALHDFFVHQMQGAKMSYAI